MTEGDRLLRLEMEPVDSLFFRDARPFEAASRAASGLPMPQTLAGAVRSLLLEHHGVDFDLLGEKVRSGDSVAEALAEFGPAATAVADIRVRGPWFTVRGEVLIPAPASLRREKRERGNGTRDTRRLFRLDPLESPLPGWRPESTGMRPLWRYGRETVERADGLLRPSGLRRFLEGGLPEPGDLVSTDDVYDFEDRTGIGVDSRSNTAAEGMIYAVRMLTLKPGANLYAEVSGSDFALGPLDAEPVLMKFGGEGRHVIVRKTRRGSVWPSVPPVAGKGRLVLLTTPAHFNGWRPPGVELVAAAVAGQQAVSGWDLAKGGPKPNRFMVPAGSTYFLPPGARIPDRRLVEDEDARLGWGSFLEGNWDYV